MNRKKQLLLSAFVMLFSVSAAEKNCFPELGAVPRELRYKPGSKISVASDGNFLVDGKPHYFMGPLLLGFSPGDYKGIPGVPKGYEWIYLTTPDYESAQRLGFDTIGVCNNNDFVHDYNPNYIQPWHTPEAEALRQRMWKSGLPLYVDMTGFEWTNSAPVFNDFMRSKLPPGAVNTAYRTPYNRWAAYSMTHPEGRKIYKRIWTDAAKLAKKYNAAVLAYELFNESGYDDPSDYNKGLFAEYLKKRYGSVERLNQVWHTNHVSFEAASKFKTKKDSVGCFVDWTKFMEDVVTSMCADGFRWIREIDPEARVTVQVNGDSTPRFLHRTGMNMYRISKELNAVAFPTAGAHDSRSDSLFEPVPKAIQTGDIRKGEHFIIGSLFRLFAEGKPLFNNENYTGTTCNQVFQSVWMDAMNGSSATYEFSWASGVAQWKSRTPEGAKEYAGRNNYNLLNPYLCPVETFKAFANAKKELAGYQELYLPRDRKVPPEVALLLSYPTERFAPPSGGNNIKNEIVNYAAGIRFLHIPMEVILEEHLSENRAKRYKAVVAAGIRNTYPGTVKRLLEYVRGGGILIVSRDFMRLDEYGNPHGEWGDVLDLKIRRNKTAETQELNVPQWKLLPGTVPGRPDWLFSEFRNWEVVGSAGDSPVILRRKLGKGWLYLASPEMDTYMIASVMGGILDKHDIRPVVELARFKEKDLASNVEIFPSKLDGKFTLFLFNHDRFPKMATLKSGNLKTGFDLVNKWELPVNENGCVLVIPPRSRAVIGLGTKEQYAKFGPFRRISVAELEKIHASQAVPGRTVRENDFKPDLARTKTLDLREYANMNYTDDKAEDGKGGWTDQGPENGLNGVPWGMQMLRGVPYDSIRPDMNEYRTCIVMRNTSMKACGNLPGEIKDIMVNEPVKNIWFFYTCAWAADGKRALTFRVNYADGSRAEIPLTVGKNVFDWWINTVDRNVMSHVAWMNSDKRGFYMLRWKNPEPEKVLRSIDILASGNEVAGIVMGITVEQQPPVRRIVPKLRKRWCSGGLDSRESGNGIEFFFTKESADKRQGGGWTQFPDLAEFFRDFDENVRDGFLTFQVRGGADRHRNPVSHQKLDLFLVKINTQNRFMGRTLPIEIEKYMEDGFVSDKWSEVRIPLNKFVWQDLSRKDSGGNWKIVKSWNGFNGFSLNFREDTGSAFAVRDVRFEFPLR